MLTALMSLIQMSRAKRKMQLLLAAQENRHDPAAPFASRSVFGVVQS